MDAKTIGKKIYELRKENGFTQRELADKVNVTNKAVSKWENGVNFPDPGIMDDLAEALGVTVTELIDDKPMEDRVNKPLLYAAVICGLLPAASEFIFAYLESFGKTGYVVFGLQIVAFVLLLINFILNEKFLWTNRDGRTYQMIIRFGIAMGYFVHASYIFVTGTEYAGLFMGVILMTADCMQEITYSKKSKGVLKRTLYFAAVSLILLFVLYWIQPVKW